MGEGGDQVHTEIGEITRGETTEKCNFHSTGTGLRPGYDNGRMPDIN
jgi:hypothetical protein